MNSNRHRPSVSTKWIVFIAALGVLSPQRSQAMLIPNDPNQTIQFAEASPRGQQPGHQQSMQELAQQAVSLSELTRLNSNQRALEQLKNIDSEIGKAIVRLQANRTIGSIRKILTSHYAKPADLSTTAQVIVNAAVVLVQLHGLSRPLPRLHDFMSGSALAVNLLGPFTTTGALLMQSPDDTSPEGIARTTAILREQSGRLQQLIADENENLDPAIRAQILNGLKQVQSVAQNGRWLSADDWLSVKMQWGGLVLTVLGVVSERNMPSRIFVGLGAALSGFGAAVYQRDYVSVDLQIERLIQSLSGLQSALSPLIFELERATQSR